MKKLVVLIFIVLLLAACSDEWYAHDSVYKDWEHIKFSWWGEIPYIPAE
jgi:hypothetical protein